MKTSWITLVCALLSSAALEIAAGQAEIPAGTRFLVELRTRLESKKTKPGKKFKALTLEALRAADGSLLSSSANLNGHVSYVEANRMVLRFEQIDTGRGKIPLVASVVGVVGERAVRKKAGEEGEIRASGGRGATAAVGAAVGAALGAAAGSSQGGGKGAAVGAGTGAAAGALIGAIAGGRDLVLDKGTRIELQLDRPLVFEARR